MRDAFVEHESLPNANGPLNNVGTVVLKALIGLHLDPERQSRPRILRFQVLIPLSPPEQSLRRVFSDSSFHPSLFVPYDGTVTGEKVIAIDGYCQRTMQTPSILERYGRDITNRRC